MMADYQITFNGLDLGPDTGFELIRVDGLFTREMLLNLPDLPRYHGAFVGVSYHQHRTINLEVEVQGDPAQELTVNRRRLLEAFQPLVDEEKTLTFKLPGEEVKQVECRPRTIVEHPIDHITEAGAQQFFVHLTASDPAIYSTVLSTGILEPFTPAGGMEWPAVWPIDWGAAGTGAGIIITNSGEWETWPTFEISGPTTGLLTNPIIESVTLGKRLALNAHGGASIGPSQTLIISTHPVDRFIRFDTGASRYGRLSDDSEFFPLMAGPNELRFRASGDTEGAVTVANARSAWI